MQLIMTNDFNELSQNEMREVNGGVAPLLVFLGKVAVTALAAGTSVVVYNAADGAVEKGTGQGIGEWIETGWEKAKDALGVD